MQVGIAGLSTMKKGFSNFMSSIDSALKSSPDDMSDTLSIRSDASSDSENYIMVNADTDLAGSDLMFIVNEFVYENNSQLEVATEVIEEENSVTTTSDHSLTSSGRRKDLVREKDVRRMFD